MEWEWAHEEDVRRLEVFEQQQQDAGDGFGEQLLVSAHVDRQAHRLHHRAAVNSVRSA